jgi:hypothetical protein
MKTILVVAACGIGATVPSFAHDEARIFSYRPMAQLVRDGQYRAEVWKRENASGKEELAWSNSDLHASWGQALAAACATLRENFLDDSSACSQTSRDAKAGEKGPLVTEKSGVTNVKRLENSTDPARNGSNDWETKFWKEVLALYRTLSACLPWRR